MSIRRFLSRRHIQIEPENTTVYHSDFQMYKEPPTGNIMADEFEKLALERLQLLKTLERARLKGHKRYSDSWKAEVQLELQKNNATGYLSLLGFVKNEANYEARRADHLSHWILCFVIAHFTELRVWFVTRELELFKMRCDLLSKSAMLTFLKDNNLICFPLPKDEKNQLKRELSESTKMLKCFEETDFYIIPFTKVPSLVKRREVYIRKGIACVPDYALYAFAYDAFHLHLGDVLSGIEKCSSSIETERISHLIDKIQKTIPRSDFTPDLDTSSTSKNLDRFSKIHYPLCMRVLHDQLRTNHHLKHGSRVQYGAFIKTIGISVEDAISFWREEFTKIMPEDKFEKHYAYYIRYTYGLVGRMRPVQGFSCSRIFEMYPTATDCKGCPFKHSDKEELARILADYGFAKTNVNDIVGLASKGLYHAACTKYFGLTHPESSTNEIHHPNQYYNESIAQSTKNPDIEDIFAGADENEAVDVL